MSHTSPHTEKENKLFLPVIPYPVHKAVRPGTFIDNWVTNEDKITNNLFGRSFTSSLTS